MAAPPKYHEPVQGTVFHGDGREQALLKHLQSLDTLQQSANDETTTTTTTSSDGKAAPTTITQKPHDYERSQRVLDAIHDFGKGENRYLMSVGETKGKQVEGLIRDKKPKLILELGAYVGYSGISFSRALPDLHPTSIYPPNWTSSTPASDRAGYISLEKSEVYAETARGAAELAGLGGVIKILVGSSTPNLRSLRETLNLPRPAQFDMVFLDHLKPLYTIDLKVMEEEGLVGPGTILVADNVVKPGNPPYLSYVRASPSSKRAALSLPKLTSQPAPTPNPEDTADAWRDAFRSGPIDETRWVPVEAEGIEANGDPSLKYSSEMLDGWDPYTGERDACEVSVCLGREGE